jgi:hypothetical protein
VNQDKINKSLAEKNSDSSPWQKALCEQIRKWMSASADKMSAYHDEWDRNSYVYRGYRVADKEDIEAVKDGEPTKIIIPITYAQIQTAISFILSTYQQRKYFFELCGTGPEDVKPSFALTTDLNYQLNKQQWILKLYFWLLSAYKQGFGVVRTEWDEQYQEMRVGRQVADMSMASMLGAAFGRELSMQTKESVEEVLCYQGNTIRNISPYAFYPDPAVNIADFQDGSFVAIEEEVSKVSVTSREGEIYFGTGNVPETMGKQMFSERPRRVKGPFDGGDGDIDPNKARGGKGLTCVRVEIEFTMSEKELSKLTSAKFGDGEKPIKWLATMINDQKLVRFERKGYLHKRYNFELFECSPDNDAHYNPGLASTISELQTIQNFMLNSHIVNVRKIIANRFIADPSKVETDDIHNGNLVIRTKGAAGDINRVIKQLDLNDITRSHVQDLEVLNQLIQLCTGVNENALGQYASGRRSATEARSVNAGAAARLKMHAILAWQQGIEPLGRQFLSNTRQWRSKEVYEMIVGAAALEAPYETTILADPTKLAGGYDFMPYEATLPSDRQFQAGVLQELFSVLIQNPNSMQLLNKNPMLLLNHIAQLYDIKNLNDFNMQPLGPPGQMVPPKTEVVTDAQADEAASGDAPVVDPSGAAALSEIVGAQ